jgi:hypothetical protein
MNELLQCNVNVAAPEFQILIKVAVHELLHRYGTNLHCKLPIGELKSNSLDPSDPARWAYGLDTDSSWMYGGFRIAMHTSRPQVWSQP